jgi:hypothetical protein
MTARRSILCFVKAPVKGAVKSRLARAVGEDAALALYRCFVSDTLATLGKAASRLVICYHPADRRHDVESWLGASRSYMPQEGRDLGERMRNAFARAFSYGHEKAILIGSDIPDLPLAVIEEAFAALTVHDATIGPAADGGYYLIGFRSDTFLTDAFSGITWSTRAVFKETIEILRLRGRRVHVLRAWRDVDTIHDLKDLLEKNRNGTFRDSATMSLLRSRNLFRPLR